MALTKITSDVIGTGAVTSDHLASGAVTHSSLSSITTDNVSEGSTNTYFTNARARGSVSVTGGGLSYDSGTGVIQIGSIPNASLTNSSLTVNSNSVSLGGSVTLDTDDIGEGSTNLYFTNARAQGAISGGTGVTVSSGEISIGQDVATSSTPTFGNITTTGYIAGPATFTIDPAAVGDNTGTVVIAGNLQVDGTTTTINSTTMEVDDLNITLASGAANAAAANGAGITVDGANATINYNGTLDTWEFNKELRLTTGSFASHVNGNRYIKYRSTYDSAIVADFELKSDNNSAAVARITSTGIADVLQVFDNTTQVVTIADGGNVGIGTDQPNQLLHLDNSTNTTDSAGIRIISGTEGNARILFGDSGYGSRGRLIYSNSDDSLQFWGASSTTSEERMRIDSSGNVGIGGSPTNYSDHKTLSLYGNTGTGAGFIEFNDTSGNADAVIFSDNGNLFINADYDNTTADSSIRFRVDGSSEKMRIDSSGNLIMTAGGTIRAGGVNDLILDAGESGTPDIYLQSGGATKVKIEGSNGQVMIGHTSSFAHGDADNLAIGDGSSNSGLTIYTGADKESSIIFGNNGTNGNLDAGIKYYHESHGTVANRRAMTFATGGSMAERMRIDSSGNVGIAATPSGEAASAHVVRLGDQVCIAEYDDGSNPEQFNLFHNSDSSETYIETGYATNIQQRDGEITFKTAASGTAGAAITFSDRVKILNNGNVGIGDTSPMSRLQVDTPNYATASTYGRAEYAGLNLTIPNTVGAINQLIFSNAAAESYGYGGIGMIMTSGSGVGLADMVFTTKDSGSNVVSTERMRIKSDGQITTGGDILPGADVIMANGRGISFAATANSSGSMSNELLDDYEEGTWTPACGATLSTAVGKYTKIGNQVTVYYHLVTTGGLPTSTSQVIITGLPFTSNLGSLVAAPIYSRYYTPNDSSLTSLVQDSETQIRLMNINDQNFDYTIWGELEASGNNSVYIIGSATYMV